MNRPSILGIAIATCALAGCASTGANYANSRAVPVADGYYVPAQAGQGDYYFGAPSGALLVGGGIWQFGYGMGLGPGWGWYGPGSPWWAVGPGPWWWHVPGWAWGYPHGPWYGPGSPSWNPPGKVVARAPISRVGIGPRPVTPVQLQWRAPAPAANRDAAPRAREIRAPRHGFERQRR